MNRREWLKCVSALAVGVVAAPSLLAAFDAHAAAQAAIGSTPQFFTSPQGDLLAAVVDIILPRGKTPGAIDAGVPAFIDQMFKDVYTPAEQQRYLGSLAAFDRAGGKPFLQLDDAQRKALVTKLHREALAHPGDNEATSAANFVMMTKKLTMMGFFLSEPGCTQVLQYSAVPGGYQADVPLSKAGNGKAWAVETVLTL
ncbi:MULTISPECIES: gluconate 2-dehydrogenase subunit 3 family protein [Dyella]|uniref:gluconate 2-dehydrogenase subunit 3 family protein n=1 Tax=Dyella TaxID=231454 RepID=UPI000C81F979|nr:MULTISPECIES: gluconate 2-dehydrogenase subunit 3 family protein [Dyella]MDR3447734.1 gluconate 2-dehydrogenase subunit 3 family protein [Dyella sp.]PMQ05396.1 Gluconate 2-dehydrogenase subunit 3 [Dyella sp. AD56]ULU24622.1 gluconate 2-dehydrogenase subunit 3 family protein [Dyella terrae]